MEPLQSKIHSCLSKRRVGGWRTLVLAEGFRSIQQDTLKLVVSSLKRGKDPKRTRKVLSQILLENISILDLDILVRLQTK